MNKLSRAVAALAFLATPAWAQLGPSINVPIGPQAGGGGGGGGGSVTTTCPPGTGTTINNGYNVLAETSDHPATAAECGAVYEVKGAALITITMPTIASQLGYTVINQNPPGGANVAVAADATHTIGNNGASSITVPPGMSVGIAAGSGASPTNWDLGPGLSGSPANADPYKAALWYVPSNWVNITTSAATNATTIYCAPGWMNFFPNNGSGTLGALALRIATVGTSNTQLAIYDDDTTVSPERPGALLGNTADIANTSVGTPSASITGVSISGGLKWFCLESDDATMKFEGLNGNNSSLLLGQSVGSTSINTVLGQNAAGVTTAGTYGTWPASLHGSTWSETTVGPLIGFQFSSVP